MSSRFIPGDQMAAIEMTPWQIGAFDAPRTIRGSAGRHGSLRDESTDESVSRARDEGFRHGLEVGRKQGHAEGVDLAARRNQEFDAILSGLKQSVAGLDDAIAADLIQLALAVARQVMCAHIETNVEAIVPVVREALNSVVAIVVHPRLSMHPADAEIVGREMATELSANNCRVHPDVRMTRGDVRIDDAAFELDATRATRWQRTIAALGLRDEPAA